MEPIPLYDFNSRPCVRGNMAIHNYRDALGIFQFTPLREGQRAITKGDDMEKTYISIHAPA